ncbi:DUF4091 domain-containing protein [Chitinophaga lutea]|uniref:DUF4091 domain-containing protein n=1 Tax=Chitinophaga lutea TaxID=2488634 RepID=A0A3N4Q7J1_9BACT|nr:DUF4091 domain-containing protein [Chitinophaga lutea]RPE13511.1 DUF4091 domain-containing protein [Chitinophaga lutea]
MKPIKMLLLAACFFHPALAQQKLFLADPLEPLYPDSNAVAGYSAEYTLDFPTGAAADVHLLLEASQGSTFRVQASMNGKMLPQSCWSLLTDVPVEQNTGLDSRTEQYKGRPNPFVIRRAPFRIYEVISPLSSPVVQAAAPYTALRLSIPPAFFRKPGTYNIQVTAGHLKGAFTARIHPARLPALKDSRFFYTNWFSLPRMEQWHHVERWSSEWFAMLDKYAAAMAAGRQNCILVPAELIYLKNGKITLEEDKMLRFINVFRRYGFQYFESPHLMYRGEKDDWGNPELQVQLTQRGYNTAAAKRDIDTIMTLVARFTRANGLTHSWLQHISDEPTRTQAQSYSDVVKQVKAIYPEVRIMEATNDRDGLIGAVDIWCPLINDFQENESFFRAREKAGEKVLVYTCLIPGGNWLNRLLDQEKLRQVYFGWGAVRYGTFGYLHWGLNQYNADPFQNSVIHHPAPGAGANNFLPAGDTHIFYPGKHGPLSSLRFEAHRLGIEDYELLARLEQRDALVAKVFRSYTDYDKNVKAYRAARAALLQASR